MSTRKIDFRAAGSDPCQGAGGGHLAVLEDLLLRGKNLSLLVSYSPLGALNFEQSPGQNAGHEPLAVMLQP